MLLKIMEKVKFVFIKKKRRVWYLNFEDFIWDFKREKEEMGKYRDILIF